ncbi:hypothetical protein KAJ27_08625 [bacterium]|nr:hypothetical protein [bacterium]
MKKKKLYIFLLTFLIEAVTVLFRYGFKMESTRDTKNWIAPLTFGIRIHHGYIGLLLVILSMLCFRRWKHHGWVEIIGYSMLYSDLIHHFLVLWPIEGSPQFDLVY